MRDAVRSISEPGAARMLLLISAAAIACYYVLPNLSSLAFGATSGLKGIAPWVDLNSAQSALYQHQMDGPTWAQLSTSFLIWVAIPLLVGVLRVLRAEIRSA